MAGKGINVIFCAPGEAPLTMDVTEVTLPGAAGIFTVLPGHTPLLSTLLPGVVVLHGTNGGPKHFAVSGGVAEVRDDTVRLLVELFEPGDRIDPERAKAARDRAEERLKKPGSDLDVARAERALQRAFARLGAHAREGI